MLHSTERVIAFKKLNMQVPVFTIGYTAANVSNPAGRVATGFPLPSTGRGIEGEGWSFPEPPPVRFFLFQPHPASKLKTAKKQNSQKYSIAPQAVAANALAANNPVFQNPAILRLE